MSTKKILPPLVIGIMSAVAVSLTLSQGLYTWVLFIGW